MNKLSKALLITPFFLTACNSMPVDANKKLVRYEPQNEEIVVSKDLQTTPYILPENFDHGFEVTGWEVLVDADFRQSESIAPLSYAPISEFSYFNEQFVEPTLTAEGIELLPQNFAVNPAKNKVLWASGVQLYLQNSPWQAYYIQLSGHVENDGKCEAEPFLMISAAQGDLVAVETECQQGDFNESYYVFSKGETTRLALLSALRRVNDTEIPRHVQLHTLKVTGLQFEQSPLDGNSGIRIAATSQDCPFQSLEGDIEFELDQAKAHGYLSSETGERYRLKGVLAPDLTLTFNLLQTGGTYNRDYQFGLIWLQGGHSTLRDRWGCSFIMETRREGYYGELNRPNEKY